VLREIGWSGPLEVGAGDVIEHQIRLEAEEVPETIIERYFDLVFGSIELIERAVPRLQLTRMDADSAVGVPIGSESSALAITEEVRFKPAGQVVLAGGPDESVG